MKVLSQFLADDKLLTVACLAVYIDSDFDFTVYWWLRGNGGHYPGQRSADGSALDSAERDTDLIVSREPKFVAGNEHLTPLHSGGRYQTFVSWLTHSLCSLGCLVVE